MVGDAFDNHYEQRQQLALAPLPNDMAALLDRLRAPPRLIAHLKLVHDVATQIVAAICRQWPALEFDEPSVLFGAATHDIGKILHPEELSGSGSRQEEAGALLLLQHGVSSWRAHFAWIHGQWCNVPRPLIDDLLVALADTIWNGKRDLDLEQRIAAEIGQAVGEDMWVVFQRLDELIEPMAVDGDRRLAWQARFLV